MSATLPSKGYNYALTAEQRNNYVARDNAKPISTSTAVLHKQAERDRIAADIAAFERRGGRIEKLGTTLGQKPERRPLRDLVHDAFQRKQARHAALNRLAEEEE